MIQISKSSWHFKLTNYYYEYKWGYVPKSIGDYLSRVINSIFYSILLFILSCILLYLTAEGIAWIAYIVDVFGNYTVMFSPSGFTGVAVIIIELMFLYNVIEDKICTFNSLIKEAYEEESEPSDLLNKVYFWYRKKYDLPVKYKE